VRLFGRSAARSLLVALLVSSLVDAPSLAAAADKPLGSIVLAHSALLGNMEAVAGADVYPGDVLRTNTDGLLRLKMGENQFYLAQGTTATLSPQGNGLHARVESGTAGFSAVGQQVEIETPVATVRPAGNERAFGQVTVTGPNQMVVAAYQGTLAVEGSDQTINAGQSYQVTLVADNMSPSPQDLEGYGGKQENNVIRPYKPGKKKLLFVLILLGSTAIAGFYVFHQFSVSCSDPDC